MSEMTSEERDRLRAIAHLCGPCEVLRLLDALDAAEARAADATERALHDVAVERQRQTEKWGVQTHAAPIWLAIIGEEFGETCEAVLQARAALRPGCSPAERHGSMERVRKEAVQVAASAVSMIERIDAGLDLFEGRGAVAEAEQRTAERIAAAINRWRIEGATLTSMMDRIERGDWRRDDGE